MILDLIKEKEQTEAKFKNFKIPDETEYRLKELRAEIYRLEKPLKQEKEALDTAQSDARKAVFTFLKSRLYTIFRGRSEIFLTENEDLYQWDYDRPASDYAIKDNRITLMQNSYHYDYSETARLNFDLDWFVKSEQEFDELESKAKAKAEEKQAQEERGEYERLKQKFEA